MSTGWSSWKRNSRLFIIALLALPLLTSVCHAQSNAWDVAILDQILANVPPGQTLAQVGDMFVKVSNLKAWRSQLAGGVQIESAFDGTIPMWTGGNVYYTFSNNVSAAHQKAFLDGMNEWATFANLHLFPRATQSNYVTIVDGGTLQEGGDSAVGMIGGQQYIHIGNTSWNRPTVCHEFGHTLGLIHEHQRSDRDSFVMILTNNIIPGLEPDFTKLTTSLNEGAYGFLSVMHYGRNALSISNTLDTVEPLPAYMQYLNIMGQQFDPVLSALDRSGMAARYGSGPSITNIVTNTQDSGPGSLRAAIYFAIDHPGTTITFNIPTSDPGFSNSVFNIQPTYAFPSMANAMIIDGTTEPTNSNPNGPEIVLNGALSTLPDVFANGLRMAGTNCAVQGLVINGFNDNGIAIEGSNAVGNLVAGCYIGTDASGTTSRSNLIYGILIDGGAHSNTIGGTTVNARNVISGSAFQGLVIRGTGVVGNVVLGNYIGLNASGSAELPNRFEGIAIDTGAASNTIGGTVAGAGNVIAGNHGQGITIRSGATDGTVIQGNYIGVDAAGLAGVSNYFAGIEINGGPKSTLIGGTITGARNIISGNGAQGIGIFSNTTDLTIIQGNFIGVDVTGSNAIANRFAGIEINQGAKSTVVGGTTTAARNIISGNRSQGIAIFGSGTDQTMVQGNYIGLDVTGTAVVSNTFAGIEINGGPQSTIVGGVTAGAGNVISGNHSQGMGIFGANGTVVQGNLIGTDPFGIVALGNRFPGIEIGNGSQSNMIGGTVVAARNLISGNASDGIYLHDPRTSGNRIQGNYIGVNVNGATSLGNAFSGIELCCGAASNTIGGTTSGAGNLVSGNSNYGIVLGGEGTDATVIQGNLVGVDASGSTAIPNAFDGVIVYGGAQFTQIGGPVPGARNIISGNLVRGVGLFDPGTKNNFVQGNFIGLNATGNTAVANGYAGVNLSNGCQSNTVGGGVGARNIISGNTDSGIVVDFTNTDANVIQGNTIGLDATSTTPIPNQNAGISIFNAARFTQVGGTALGTANVIASNLIGGVELFDVATTNNSILGNSIFDNGIGGIGLNGAANTLQNAPTITSAVQGTNLVISGSLAGRSNTTFRIEFFHNPKPPSSPVQGKTCIGAINVTTGSGGTASFSVGLPITVSVNASQPITATATDPAGNTSPFSSGTLISSTDSVGDGIPNAWRAAFFGGSGNTTNTPGTCATCDPDHDGFTNLQEYHAGTNPTNAASALRIASVQKSGNDSVISFVSVAGKIYRIEVKDEIQLATWTLLVDQIVGTGSPIFITDPGASSLPKRFYRALVLP